MTAAPPSSPPFRDPRLPFARRAQDLCSRLTVEEKAAFLHQFVPAVERLGVAAFRTGQEALHGVAWMGPATVFPQAVGLGATWNPDLVRRVGEAVSRELRAMRARDERVGLNVWAPVVNPLRHPLWGRNEEGYSEDARLTSVLAAAYTRGLRGDHPVYWRSAPVLKHWLAHNNETDRDTASSSVRPRVLHEFDLRAFRGAVEAGAVAGVMPAYNLVNGRPNHVSPYLRDPLRTWTDQELLVCSDAGAPSNLVDSEHYFDTHEQALAASLRAGVDSFTDHGEDSATTVGRVLKALGEGLLTEADLDRAVTRQLSVRLRLGEFDPDGGPHARDLAFDTPEHRALAQEAAEQSVVLLRNEGVLPLAPGARVAVVGLLADECKVDWYSGALIRSRTPLAGLRERFGAERVEFAEGADRLVLRTSAGDFLRVPGAAGASGPARDAEGALDPALLTGRTDLPPVTTGGTGTEFAVVDWGEGVLTLRAPDGRLLSVAEDGYVRASADRPGGWVVQETFRLEPRGDGHLLRHLGTGRCVTVGADGVRVAEAADGAGEVFRTVWTARGEEEAARAAAGADVVVVVAGNDPHINGRETQDRRTLRLPGHQERLLRAALAANPRTVLALVSSYPYAVDVDRVPAVLWSAHGGQAAGTALARVLAGDVSPSGRLPQTWYADDADLPPLLDYDLIASRQTYLYFEGEPLFPFGHGLSYAEFAYQDLSARVEGDAVRVSFSLTNAGGVAAAEVAQLYVRAVSPSVPRPRRELLAHRREVLEPGRTAVVSFDVPLPELAFWDVALDRPRLEGGAYEFLVGASAEDVRLRATVTVDGEPAAPRAVVERGIDAASFDEQSGVEIVDRTKVEGDAVTPLDRDHGELLYRDCDFGSGVAGVVVEVSGTGSVELSLGDGSRVARLAPEGPTAGPYDYAVLSAPLAAHGVHDLRVRLRGPLRLARMGFTG
ncbi:glycoside hydrolase family 3 C-terminal domain-containing protein [Streptomyces fragilis]|uniref:Glycoside hydrolase family 3 C-terminal domain-containing protein n=1 Tax=Streptomyces fragilis TaxID=67301 RepID=A0ABV2YJ74_9ACTN|nr:glycoside hydrolase family 3 C-terminal domain-containing protein [Streptomyces fragilis]